MDTLAPSRLVRGGHARTRSPALKLEERVRLVERSAGLLQQKAQARRDGAVSQELTHLVTTAARNRG